MCGIAGILYFNGKSPENRNNPEKILKLLKHRGPDSQTYRQLGNAVLYHARLGIIDPTAASNQPFMSDDQTEAMVYNGEIFNYTALRQGMAGLKTTGDTEVLFNLVRKEGKNCLNKLNGFFAFAYYHQHTHTLLLARDRFGVKPLYYYSDSEKFIFASELKPLLALAGPQVLNTDQLYTYLRFNYCAGSESIFKNVRKLLPGQCMEVSNNSCKPETWYTAPRRQTTGTLATLLDDAVRIRLQADVPVGTFLSGGLDSSIISALAKKHKPDLNTFSIGFEEEQYFDETHYAGLVAKHIGSNHHVFKLKEADFINHIHGFLNAVDEPFADSSAFNFYMLCQYTRQHVKVALSGDGADELFKGYYKHKALLLSQNPLIRLFAKTAGAVVPAGGSRHGAIANKLRQLKKFAALSGLSPLQQQQLLASISTQAEAEALLHLPHSTSYFDRLFASGESLANFELKDTIDIQTVLADDMLVKADRFSMQHGVEIRNPFVDYRVVEFALNLTADKKINARAQKIILREEFRPLLPEAIFTRRKKGFELPLQKWLSGSLRSRLDNDWLHAEKIKAEGILNYTAVEALKQQLFSASPGDSAAKVWGLVVLQSWLQNFKEYIQPHAESTAHH